MLLNVKTLVIEKNDQIHETHFEGDLVDNLQEVTGETDGC